MSRLGEGNKVGKERDSSMKFTNQSVPGTKMEAWSLAGDRSTVAPYVREDVFILPG